MLEVRMPLQGHLHQVWCYVLIVISVVGGFLVKLKANQWWWQYLGHYGLLGLSRTGEPEVRSIAILSPHQLYPFMSCSPLHHNGWTHNENSAAYIAHNICYHIFHVLGCSAAFLPSFGKGSVPKVRSYQCPPIPAGFWSFWWNSGGMKISREAC